MALQDKFLRLMGFDLIVTSLTTLHHNIESIRELLRAHDRNRVLACVTVICEGVDHDGKKVFTTMGEEAFVAPGGRVMIPIAPQRMTGEYTFFVSGHPNLLITGFSIGNDFKMSNSGCCKFGRVHGTCEIGQRIQVDVEYRVER